MRGLHIYESNDYPYAYLHTNGHTLRVADEGIHQNSYGGAVISGGVITSSSRYSNTLRFNLAVSTIYSFNIDSIIADNEKGRVALDISGLHTTGVGQMTFAGGRANTFTGDVHISGSNHLVLWKSNDVTSINGDIFIHDGAYLALFKNNQIKDSSTIRMGGEKGGAVYFSNQGQSDISEKIKGLVVGGGGGYLLFETGPSTFPHGQRHLYLDDLEIKAGSELLVKEWEWGRDHLLVKRDSEHLEESLKRIKFAGYDPNAVHLVGYDKDYWEINALPEPATYGAALALASLGLSYHHRRKHRKARTNAPTTT